MLNNLIISQNLTNIQIDELIYYSNTDPLIIANTKDKQRFKDKNTFNKWFKLNKKIYTLEDKQGKLMGIIWFSKEKIPQNDIFITSFETQKYTTTFAIRLYQKARGKGFSKVFMREVFEKYGNADGIWLQTKEENQKNVNLYLSFGFIKVTDANKTGRITMILP